jgi:hypothetical protein
VAGITTSRSVATGVNGKSLANMTRYLLPLLVAFWPVLPAAWANLRQNRDDWRIRMMAIWIVPGSLFFLVSYISDAPYLDFLSAAVLLLAVKAPRRMALTAVWNAVLFLSFYPIPSQRLAVNTWNCYVVKYTGYGIRHQWWPNLSDIVK